MKAECDMVAVGRNAGTDRQYALAYHQFYCSVGWDPSWENVGIMLVIFCRPGMFDGLESSAFILTIFNPMTMINTMDKILVKGVADKRQY